MKRLSAGLVSWSAALLSGCGSDGALPVPPLDAAAPTHIETATFALGWFWHPDSQFGSIPGVVRTRVGYAGGKTKNPTYYSIGDHTETLQIDYDPREITYAELLNIFWKTHNGCESSGSRQYMTAVFYENEEQKRLAFETRDREAERRGAAIVTAILPATEFTIAEDYHQKYMLRHRAELMRDMRRMYPNDVDFVNSPTAARLNGYLGGFGSRTTFEKEVDSYGLSEEGRRWLTTLMQGKR